VNFIAVTQIIAGDWSTFYYIEDYCAGGFGNDAENGHEAKASHYIFDQPWQ